MLGSIFAYRKATLYFVHFPDCPLCKEFRGPFVQFAASLGREARVHSIDITKLTDLKSIPFEVKETPTIVLITNGEEHRYAVTTAPATAAGLRAWYKERVR